MACGFKSHHRHQEPSEYFGRVFCTAEKQNYSSDVLLILLFRFRFLSDGTGVRFFLPIRDIAKFPHNLFPAPEHSPKHARYPAERKQNRQFRQYGIPGSHNGKRREETGKQVFPLPLFPAFLFPDVFDMPVNAVCEDFQIGFVQPGFIAEPSILQIVHLFLKGKENCAIFPLFCR